MRLSQMWRAETTKALWFFFSLHIWVWQFYVKDSRWCLDKWSKCTGQPRQIEGAYSSDMRERGENKQTVRWGKLKFFLLWRSTFEIEIVMNLYFYIYISKLRYYHRHHHHHLLTVFSWWHRAGRHVTSVTDRHICDTSITTFVTQISVKQILPI